MKICNSISFSISSNYCSITAAVEGINEFIKSTGKIPGDEFLFDMKVIVNELLINAIKHGNQCSCNKCVTISASVTDDGYLCLTVKDEGKGYNFGKIADKCLKNIDVYDVSMLDDCGRGMLIVKNLSDRLLVSDNGSRIEVFKKL